MKTVALSITKTTNLGDLVSRPHLYFDLGNVTSADIRVSMQQLPKADLFVAGGGGIMHKMPVPKTPAKRVVWGVGWTIRPLPANLRKLPQGYDLIGSRDFGQAGAEYVPCASCMSPLFDQQYNIEHEAVLYVNYRESSSTNERVRHVFMPDIKGLPVMGNGVSFPEAVRFLGQADTIVTTSYHGAYWGTLLGRKVVIVNPYSTKFLFYKFQPPTCAAEDWQRFTREARVFPEALADARRSNLAFYEKVRNL